MMAKYQQYDEYKETSLVWMGKVPDHWGVNKFKWIFKEKSKVLNPALPAGSISFGSVIYKNENNLSPDTKASYQEVLNGEYLINPLNLNFDLKSLRTALSGIDVVVSTGYIVLIHNGGFDKQYLRWLLYEFDVAHMKKLGAGVRQTINYTDIANSLFFHPKYKEQAQIAKFLDHETAQIDTLIDKQQTLIQLLKEKRQAVISHAVIKGLNPDAPMKESGVEWLGEVPEHWNFATVRRYLLEHRQGYYTSDPYVDDGTKLLRITDLRELGEIDIKECPMVFQTQSLKNYFLKEGDVVFARTGGAGSFGVIPKLKEDVAYASYLIRFKFLPRFFDTEYLRFMLIADSFQLAVKSNIHGGVTQNIHAEDIKNTFVASPPLEEQNKISAYLIAQTNSYADLINKAEQAIQLMQERRTALISAAVTGKIDVRGWQAPE